MMKKWLLILVVVMSLFSLTGCGAPKPAAVTPTPAVTQEPIPIEHVLPAPEIFMGLSEDTARLNQPGAYYALELTTKPQKAIDAYCDLLVEKYGLMKEEDQSAMNVLGAITMLDDQKRECLTITWLEHPAGNRLMLQFARHCATAALEVMEEPEGIHPETEDDWELCPVCSGTDECPDCHGRGYVEEHFFEGESHRYDCERCVRGKCPEECINGRIYKHHKKED